MSFTLSIYGNNTSDSVHIDTLYIFLSVVIVSVKKSFPDKNTTAADYKTEKSSFNPV